MEKQRIRIQKYDWLVDIYYLPSQSDMAYIMNEMFMHGASYESLDRVSCNVCKENSGCCYTNPQSRYTSIIVGRATSISQFFNTFVHELNHLCGAIEEEYSIDPHSEEASYLIGDVAMQIMHNAKFR